MARTNPFPAIGTPIAEGVRFEIGEAAAYAVRNESRDIAVRVRREPHFLRSLFGRLPFARGIVRLFCAVRRFFAGLGESADLFPQVAVRGGGTSRRVAALFRTHPQSLWALLSGLAIPLILGALSLGLPWATERALSCIDGLPRFAVNAVCCLFRVSGTVLAIYLISRLKLVNRLCMYRGAASKVLNAYEAYGPELTQEEAALSSCLTDRSDGAFAIAVMILSMIAFACVRTTSLPMQLACRAGILLASAAVVNEIILPLERARSGGVGALLRAPLVGLQHLFTIEPHDQMIEVAICAFRAAYENDLP